MGYPQHSGSVVYSDYSLNPRGEPGGDKTGSRTDVGDLRSLSYTSHLRHLLDDALVVVSKTHGVPVRSDTLEESLDVFSRSGHVKRLLLVRISDLELPPIGRLSVCK